MATPEHDYYMLPAAKRIAELHALTPKQKQAALEDTNRRIVRTHLDGISYPSKVDVTGRDTSLNHLLPPHLQVKP